MIKGYIVLYLFGGIAFLENISIRTVSSNDMDLVLLLLALVSVFFGSCLQYVEVKKDDKTNERIRIIFATPVVVLVSWGLGYYLNKWWLTTIIATLGGFMSLDLLESIKNGSLKVFQYLPEVMKKYIDKKINNNGN
jgi:hypothetical protein